MRTTKSLFLLALLPLLATGCGVTVNNMTPKTMARNPSGLYTVAVEVTRNGNAVVAGTVQPILMLPDRAVPMIPMPKVNDRWEYTIALAPNVNQWPYYFKVNYQAEKALVAHKQETIINPANAPAYQYVLRIHDGAPAGLSARRGRVGSEIKVIGQSFANGFQVVFDGKAVPTQFESDTTLSFRIPPVEGNKPYAVAVDTGKTTLKYGELLVDESQFLTSSTLTSIDFGGQALVDIAIPQPAPTGGVAVKLESSDPELLPVPASVTIPQGESRIRVTVKARHMGNGTISLSAPGFADGSLPFVVTLVKSK